MTTLALTPIIELTPWDLALAAGLMLVAGVVSVALRLSMEKQLLIASLRTVVQLTAVGYVLRVVFRLSLQPGTWERWAFVAPWAIAALVLVMIAAASVASVRRPARRMRGMGYLAFVALIICGLGTTLSVTGVIIGVKPWYQPQYLIPLLGMVLGNSLNGISLTLDALLESFAERRDVVEMQLAHGASAWEAARRPIREAVRRGMIPIINTMMVVGIVSLPGMMTGQILQGADPVTAVRYQIVVMFMVAAATAGGAILIALLVFRRLFNQHHQLRAELIEKRSR